MRQDYPQGGVRLFIRTGSFRFANGATGLVHDEKDVAERITIAKEGVFKEFKLGLQVLRRTQGVSSSSQGPDDGVFVNLRGTAVISGCKH